MDERWGVERWGRCWKCYRVSPQALVLLVAEGVEELPGKEGKKGSSRSVKIPTWTTRGKRTFIRAGFSAEPVAPYAQGVEDL